ncbi:MAG: glycosyltransferase family 39 protein, partial [Phycisphaeraceae bacterium]|nr:glycosyltransferase family 39 protein [Phycisphaeraceae bacterium]
METAHPETGAQPGRPSHDRARLCVVALMLAVGACLLWPATRGSLWTDEMITWITVRRPWRESLAQRQDYAAPLYQTLLRCWVDRAGHPSELSLRWPAVLTAMLSVGAMYRLGRQCGGHRTAMWAAASLAVNPMLLLHGSEARPYTLWLLASILSMDVLLRLRRHGGRRWLTWYAAATTVMLWSHYMGILVLAGQGLWLIFGALRAGSV